MSDRLFELYRILSERSPAPDAAALARLAAGEPLGAEQDAVLDQIARSRAAADALAIALQTSANADALARAISRGDAQRPAVAHVRGRIVPLPWLAAAAAIAVGFAVMLNLTAPMEAPQSPVAAAPDAAPSSEESALMRGSFEEGAVVADSFESDSKPELFSDDFDA